VRYARVVASGCPPHAVAGDLRLIHDPPRAVQRSRCGSTRLHAWLARSVLARTAWHRLSVESAPGVGDKMPFELEAGLSALACR
jgi:hypothetical protein